MINLTPQQFSSLLVKEKLRDPIYCSTKVAGRGIPISVLDQPPGGSKNAPLILLFLGAIKNKPGRKPVFLGEFVRSLGGTVLSIYDPSLEKKDNIRMAWYQGDKELDVAAELSQLIGLLIKAVEPLRTIFVGGSAGGHAALLHSHSAPGSVCVVKNPQTIISKCYESHLKLYRQYCWSEVLEDAEPISSVINDDVTRLYSKGYENTVIYLQNSTDRMHVENHMTPFLQNINSLKNVLVVCEFFADYPGHAYPKSLWRMWVNAALSAPSTSVGSIIETFKALQMAHDEAYPEIKKSAMDMQIADWLLASARKEIFQVNSNER